MVQNKPKHLKEFFSFIDQSHLFTSRLTDTHIACTDYFKVKSYFRKK